MNPAVWTFLIVVIICSLALVAVLKLLSGVVADRRTRRIITDGMEGGAADEDENKKDNGKQELRENADDNKQ